MFEIVTIIPISSFKNSKTRLSPFLSLNQRSTLLKCMLKDITETITNYVDDIIVTSKDHEVLEYATKLGLIPLKEKDHNEDHLNNAIKDAVDYTYHNYKSPNILILPADIPLINKRCMDYILEHHDYFVISPSMGGGTNLLYINKTYKYNFFFGEYSFFKHIDEAKDQLLNVHILDSFYLSLDVNTPNDLGEILLHGRSTNTFKYLKSIGIKVKNKHASERLDVYR